MNMGRNIWKLVVVFIVASVGGTAMWGLSKLYDNVSGNRVNREIARIKASGAPTTLADLKGAPIPPEENAAVVYEKAFKLIRNPQAKKAADSLSLFVSPRVHYDTVTVVQARALLKKYQAVFPIVQMAVALDKCQFPISYDQRADNIEFRHLALMRRLATLYTAKAKIESLDGQQAEAVKSIAVIFGMIPHVKIGANLIGHLISYSDVSMGTRSLQNLIAEKPLSPGSILVLQKRLAAVDLYACEVSALEVERVTGFSYYDLLMQDFRAELVKEKEGGYDPFLPLGLRALSGLHSFDKIYYLEWMQREIDTVKRRTVKWEPVPEDREPPRLPIYIVSSICLPLASGFHKSTDKGVSEIRGSQIALELMQYKHQHGEYPPSLSALGNSGEVVDACNGQAYHYKRVGNGYTLYSIGLDGKDDGGRKIVNGMGDIVWETPW